MLLVRIWSLEVYLFAPHAAVGPTPCIGPLHLSPSQHNTDVHKICSLCSGAQNAFIDGGMALSGCGGCPIH